MLNRLLGVAALTLLILTAYFAGIGQYLSGEAYAPADRALVTLLRVLAGACAIAAFILGLILLNERDRRIMRQQAAVNERRGGQPGQSGLDLEAERF